MHSSILDTYDTIAAPSRGEFTSLRSKFIAFAIPVRTEEEALEQVALYRAEYYDARHICWAYRLGPTGEQYRSNDDGEPSGTAGKPIIGQLLSATLTDIIVLVVRYFGGVKLGTSGLIEAYREAACAALETAERKTCILERGLELHFGYDLMGEVMRAVKESGAKVTEQDFRESCRLALSLRAADAPLLYERYERLYGVDVCWTDKGQDNDQ